jgi:hypothetical protein
MENIKAVLHDLYLEQARLAARLQQINWALAALGSKAQRRHLSEAARERISAAQRARWAKWKKARGKKAA